MFETHTEDQSLESTHIIYLVNKYKFSTITGEEKRENWFSTAALPMKKLGKN
jgi:hypothetical protein